MRRNRKPVRLGAIAASINCLAILAFTGIASAASTTLTFREPEKGATFAFVDNAPKIRFVHGVPKKFSAGDEIIFTNPLEAEGKIVGKIRAVCTATETVSAKSVTAGDGFLCTALAKVPGGTLVLVAPLNKDGAGTEGAITGGTGQYAGARGTFAIMEGRVADTNTITLLE